MFRGLLGTLMGSASGLLSGAIPYLLAGSLIAGTAGGFYLGSVWYGNKYKGELDKAHLETSLVQQKYDGFKIGALAKANAQNSWLNQLQDRVRKLSDDLADEHNAHVADVQKKSNDLKKGLQNAKDPHDLSDAAIDYFKRLREQQGSGSGP